MPTDPAPTSAPESWQHDEVSGVVILPGDFVGWSDLSQTHATPVLAELVRRVLRATRPGRVLLAGPMAGRLVGVVPEDVHVDLVTRARADASELSDRAGMHSSFEVFCGGIDAFPTERTYDLVVAFGGPPLLLGPDSHGMSEAAVVRGLAQHVAPGGTLVLGTENEAGLHDLLSADPRHSDDDNAFWHAGADGFDPRSMHRHELDAVLEGCDLRSAAVFGGYPSATAPAYLVNADALTDASRPAARLLAGRAAARFYATNPALREPRQVMSRVADGHLLGALAPMWVTVARRGGADGLDLPHVLDAEPTYARRWGRLSVVGADGGTTMSWLDHSDAPEVSESVLRRDLAPLEPGEGRLLDLELRQACALRSHERIRALVRAYAAWLGVGAGTGSDGQPALASEQLMFATPANISLVAGGGHRLFDPSWHRAGGLTPTDALILGLRDFARRLLASAAAHPWRVDVTPDELTASLAAMAGVVFDDADIERVVSAEAEAESIVTGSREDEETRIQRNLTSGRFARDLPAATAVGYRELLARDRGHSRLLREKSGQVRWLEGTLRHRDRYIRELEKVIEDFEDSLTYRAVHAFGAPRRKATEAAVDTARGAAKEILPPDFMGKARAAARKLLNDAATD